MKQIYSSIKATRIVMILAFCTSILLTSCSSYVASGAMTGGAIGSAIGSITGGYRGHEWGTLIGMAAGAAVGASIEAAETARAEKAAQDNYIKHKEAYTRDYYRRNGISGNRSNNSSLYTPTSQEEPADTSKYVDPTNSGDDRIEMK